MNTPLNDNHEPSTKNDVDELENLFNEFSQLNQNSDIPFPSVPSKHVESEPTDSLPIDAVQDLPVSEQTVASLEAEIARDLGAQEEIPEVDVQEQVEEPKKDLGIQTTYYQDMSRAMGANDPKTMSELIQKARFEKELKKANSPFTSRNGKYFIGSIILLVLSVVTWLTFFQPKDEVTFITNERVRSLVYSDQDLGIDTTSIEAFQANEAIRTLLKRDHDTDSVSQIYYVQKDEMGNLRRMGIKEIFDKTGAKTPELLYNNIENNFMHGVYTTDKNYPFVILKAISYDRAFVGMKQWEPTMIDDLASYLDLPDEAANRSLIQDGFSDDIIKNKNVRVSRYVPRENDQKGLLDFIRSDGSEFNQELPEDFENQTEEFIDADVDIEPSETISLLISNFLTKPFMAKRAFAQVGGTFVTETINNDAGQVMCYKAVKRCIDVLTGNELPGTVTPSSTVTCYDDLLDPQTGLMSEPKTPQEVGNDSSYVCKQMLTGTDTLISVNNSLGFSDIAYTSDICFDPVSGDRINPEDRAVEPYDICYKPYQCNRIECRQGNRVVSNDLEGEPGVQCNLAEEVSLDFEGRKSCTQYLDLLRLQNLSGKNLCFDQNGSQVNQGPSSLDDFYLQDRQVNIENTRQISRQGGGVQCISPLTRNKRYCIDNNNKIINGYRVTADGTEFPIESSDPSVKVCFDALETEQLNDQFNRGLNGEIREVAAQAATRLRIISRIVRVLGQSGLANSLEKAADAFFQIAYADVLADDTLRFAAGALQDLEQIIRTLPPQIQQSEIIQELANLIAIVKDALGLNNNVTWVTIGNNLPIGKNVYPGDNDVEGIKSVQQALVEMGLLDPLSVTGELDIVTQQALQSFIGNNGGTPGTLDQTFISAEDVALIQQMVVGAGNLFGGEAATINDFFTQQMGLGTFNEEVRNLQMVLYNEGYDISEFDGIYDREVCNALIKYQEDQGLEIAEPNECIISLDTLDQLNTTIRENNYLGSGNTVNANGTLEGNGEFLGSLGPGSVSFVVNTAEANSLREGDVILLYTFLDESTILITRHESVINEIIERRAFENIFN